MLLFESNRPDTHEGLSYGCVCCKAGAEDRIIRQMELHPEIHVAFAARKAQHKSQGGVKSLTKAVMLPGYVFFRAASESNPYRVIKPIHDISRLLSYDDSWILRGEDYAFADWLWQHDGCVGVSKAYQVGDHIRINDGPLKELEGCIVKVDRHNRNGMVRIHFAGKQMKVWLPFEMTTEVSYEQGEIRRPSTSE